MKGEIRCGGSPCCPSYDWVALVLALFIMTLPLPPINQRSQDHQKNDRNTDPKDEEYDHTADKSDVCHDLPP
jgi:hypothetical protein